MAQIFEQFFKGSVSDLELYIKKQREKVTSLELLLRIEQVLALDIFQEHALEDVSKVIPLVKKRRNLLVKQRDHDSQLAQALSQDTGMTYNVELNGAVSYAVPGEAVEYAYALEQSSLRNASNSETLHTFLGIALRPVGFFSKYTN